jgi:UDP-GlcNAc:undecaprenyl-phosphate/decaprenyl-phosphate GlcNAc-1-phosphate transferase
VDSLWGVLAGTMVGVVSGRLWASFVLEKPNPRFLRTNVSGLQVPAVLGLALVGAGLGGLGAVLILDRALDVVSVRVALAVALLLMAAGSAGLADDLRGDESDRGFTGHLSAAAKGKITGGLIKIAGVGVAGLAAGWLVADGLDIVVCGVIVALTANLVNLFDRAPGRAVKVSLLLAAPLLVFGPGAWAVAAAGVVGAAAGLLPLDLGERGMLGDSGANALGATLGLGLFLAPADRGRIAALVVLAGLTVASELWSFSAVIERVSWLRAADRWGRSREKGSTE